MISSMLSRASSPSLRVLWTALALLLAACSTVSATSRRHLEQSATFPAPFENLPALPFVSYQQQPQQPQPQQQQPSYQQQQQPPYQQGPNNQQPQQIQGQQGPQQQGPQQQPQQQQGNPQQANLDSLAMNAASQSSSAHAPSIGFGTSTLAANVGIQLPGYIQRAQLPQVYAPAPAPAQGPDAYVSQEELQADAMAAASADGNKCLPLTKQLVTGMCLPFMAQFQTNGNGLAKLSERDFRQAIAIGPTPTDRCCRDAKDFTTAACACDPAAEALAPSLLLTAQDLQLSARAAVMACPHFHFTDPCAQA